MLTIEQIYEKHIKTIPIDEQLQLIHLIAQHIDREPKHSLLELKGLGADIWQNMDAQDYVNQLRQEWD